MIACELCNSTQFQTWRWQGLESCDNCGHIRKAHVEKANAESIQEKYFDDVFALQEDFFTKLYEHINDRRRLSDIQNYQKNGRVIEVGVGHGSLLSTLNAVGYQVEGIDLSSQVCDAVHSKYGLPVHCNTLEAYAESQNLPSYDIAIACHVLEHVASPLSALKAAKDLLKPGGILYLAVPNISAWNSYLPGWTGYEPYHLHYFHSKTLRQVVESSGFSVISQKTREPLSGWFNTLFKSIRHNSPDLETANSKLQTEVRKQGLIWSLFNIVRLTTGMAISPLRFLQDKFDRGEELILIARKL
jgi:2-polyprenyl-3-methyl-5-hydroxy-6-metoxy-1,4-benzoquinol methylase